MNVSQIGIKILFLSLPFGGLAQKDLAPAMHAPSDGSPLENPSVSLSRGGEEMHGPSGSYALRPFTLPLFLFFFSLSLPFLFTLCVFTSSVVAGGEGE